MSVIARGARNAVRNKARTIAVVLVLAVAIGLTLSMLVAGEAVRDKLSSVRGDLDPTVEVWPGFESVEDLDDLPRLSDDDLAEIENSPHVADATATVNGLLQPPQDPDVEGSMASPLITAGGAEPGETDLESDVDGDELGIPDGFAFPISVTGTTSERDSMGAPIQVTEGELPSGDREALLSEQLAEANDVSIGDTFTAYDEEFTVVGIAASESEFDSVGVVVTVSALQELSEISGYDMIVAEVNDVDNIEAAVDDIGSAVGSGFDVRSNSDSLLTASAGLSTVSDLTNIGFWVALSAAALIVFFTLAMTVRERRKEVGVIKAIGGTNRGIITQFGTEAVVLVFIAAIVGFGFAAATSGFTADTLVSSNVDESGPDLSGTMQPAGDASSVTAIGETTDLVGNVTTSVGLDTLGVGAAVALGIALLGSAIPAWLIARVRPAEVLKGE